jgi:phosphatidylserine decarboxylase
MRICKEGWPYIIGAFIAGSLLHEAADLLHHSRFVHGLEALAFVVSAFCAYFFRDPQRRIPVNDRLILSPADGRILEVVDGHDAAFGSRPVWIVHIFLSIFDPHLQRSPVAGTVRGLRYRQGKFLDARSPKAAFENEQNRIEIAPAADPSQVGAVVTQIAGLIARRICCWVHEGQPVEAGQRIGLIQFGSQVDLAFPRSAALKVRAGDHVKAGESIIAER